jgi:hypothetical protein
MFQPAIVVLLLLASVLYVARLVWRSFRAPAAGQGCAKGCGTCAVATEVEQRLGQAAARAEATR